VPGGFLEKTELGENSAGQRDVLGERGIEPGILDFRFWILDCRTPGETNGLLTCSQLWVNELLR
jgi:hypothetical protein